MRAGIAIAIAVLTATAWADVDLPTMQTAGATRCKLGPATTFATEPSEAGGAHVRLAFTRRGGLAIYDTWAQRFAIDGSLAGKRQAWKLDSEPAPAGFGDIIDSVVGLGDGFVVLGTNPCDAGRCLFARWIDASGKSGTTLKTPIGERSISIDVWTTGDAVHVLASRTGTRGAKTDAWLVLTRSGDRDLQVTSHDVDLGGDAARIQFQPEADAGATWMFAMLPQGKLELRFANSDGTSGRVTGWDPAEQLIAIGAGRELLAWSGAQHKEWIEHHLALDGTLTEVRRHKPAAELPAPFVHELVMDPDTVDGVMAHREDRLGAKRPDTLITSHPGGYPVADVWANGRFYIAYAEQTGQREALKLRTMTCR